MRAPGTLTPADVTVVDVRGLPKPAGSKRVFLTKAGRPIVTDDSGDKGRDWRARLQDAIVRAHRGAPYEGALEVSVYFELPRPRAHLRRDGSLRPSAPEYPAGRPDTTKLLRAVEDAATGLLWRDDSQIVTQTACKRYGLRPGVLLHCRRLGSGKG